MRNAAPMFPLTEEDDDQPSNQSTPNGHAKPPSRLYSNDPHDVSEDSEDEHEQAIDDDDSEDGFDPMEDLKKTSMTPNDSPSRRFQDNVIDHTYPSGHALEPDSKPPKKVSVKLAVPKISLSKGSASQTPKDSGSTPSESAVPRLIDPEDDVLSESDLPSPFVEDAPSPIKADCEDQADYLLQRNFKPMADLHSIIASLTKFPASQRSTATLYALAENAQKILKAWQDEYLMLDARVSCHFSGQDHILTVLDCTAYAPT